MACPKKDFKELGIKLNKKTCRVVFSKKVAMRKPLKRGRGNLTCDCKHGVEQRALGCYRTGPSLNLFTGSTGSKPC